MANARRPRGEPKTRQHTDNPRFRKAVTRLARRLRELRAERKWSVDEASERMNLEPVSLRRLEAAKTNPTLGTLLSIAAAFRIAVSDLLAADDPDA